MMKSNCKRTLISDNDEFGIILGKGNTHGNTEGFPEYRYYQVKISSEYNQKIEMILIELKGKIPIKKVYKVLSKRRKIGEKSRIFFL